MDENDPTNLDLEYKRYLQLLRPYLGQLVDEDVIKICDAWIQRLSTCKDNEKALRNKYVFVLCYQLARGLLDAPFLTNPPAKLQPLLDDINSDDSSTEVEYLVINSDETKTNILYDSKKIIVSETDYMSQDDKTWGESVNDSEKLIMKERTETSGVSNNQKVYYCQCPDPPRNGYRIHGEEYEYRAKNLVKKLREIKTQNMLLQKELIALKEESKSTHDDFTEDYIIKVDNATSPFLHSCGSSATLKSLKGQLQEIQENRNILIQTISNLQDQVDNFNELKKNEIEDIEAKHKLMLIKVRTEARDETKAVYEKKFEELKKSYENTIKIMQETANNEIKSITSSKDQIILEKNNILCVKDTEINRLKDQIEEQKVNIQSMMSKFIEKSADDTSFESLKIKNQILENRLSKMTKSKVKSAKIYEAKIAQLHREKHLAECSLQLQLVRQRAQIVGELTDENQTELSTSLDKLESKYKDIVANVQATAIQRRIQDQRALESILQAACGNDDHNQSQYSNPVRNHNQTYDTANSSLMRNNRVGNIIVGNKSYGDDSIGTGFCLNGQRMGELFERVYIPQKDNCNGDTK